jgi:hypothetical protein
VNEILAASPRSTPTNPSRPLGHEPAHQDGSHQRRRRGPTDLPRRLLRIKPGARARQTLWVGPGSPRALHRAGVTRCQRRKS